MEHILTEVTSDMALFSVWTLLAKGPVPATLLVRNNGIFWTKRSSIISLYKHDSPLGKRLGMLLFVSLTCPYLLPTTSSYTVSHLIISTLFQFVIFFFQFPHLCTCLKPFTVQCFQLQLKISLTWCVVLSLFRS